MDDLLGQMHQLGILKVYNTTAKLHNKAADVELRTPTATGLGMRFRSRTNVSPSLWNSDGNSNGFINLDKVNCHRVCSPMRDNDMIVQRAKNEIIMSCFQAFRPRSSQECHFDCPRDKCLIYCLT